MLKNDDEDILMEVYIPRINLRRKVYNIDSSLNDVDKNIEILNGSKYADDLYFLASHSGGGSASYFDNLIYLEKGDIVWLNVGMKKKAFVVDEIFYIQKDGYFEVVYGSSGNTLFLITCSLRHIDKQLVVKSRMIYEC